MHPPSFRVRGDKNATAGRDVVSQTVNYFLQGDPPPSVQSESAAAPHLWREGYEAAAQLKNYANAYEKLDGWVRQHAVSRHWRSLSYLLGVLLLLATAVIGYYHWSPRSSPTDGQLAQYSPTYESMPCKTGTYIARLKAIGTAPLSDSSSNERLDLQVYFLREDLQAKSDNFFGEGKMPVVAARAQHVCGKSADASERGVRRAYAYLYIGPVANEAKALQICGALHLSSDWDCDARSATN